MKVLINGIGRIGKAILKIALKDKNIQVVAINDINPCIENIAYSINYDSTYGSLKNKFKIKNNSIINKKNNIRILNEESLENIDFKNLGIDYIIDSSGVKQNIQKLKKIAVKKVFLTHPDKNADINFILGVNQDKLKKEHKVISTSSCNATALLPVLNIIDENYKIECGEITTIHPLLNHQKVLDSNCAKSTTRGVECNFEFGRSSIENIIPSQTTTIEACSYVLKNINSSFIASSSLRVPTQTVGAIEVSLYIKDTCTKEELIELFIKYEKNQKIKTIKNNFEKLVSCDFKQLSYNAAIDHRFTDVKLNKMLKLTLWYDNEWGYASKVLEAIKYIDTL